MSQPIRLVTYNIQYTLGRDGVFDLDRIAREVEGADIIALQEVENFIPRSGDVHQGEEFAKRFPDFHYVYGPGVDVDGAFRDSAGALVRRRRQFGNMLLSRFPILWSKNHMLPKYGPLNTGSPQRAMLECCLDVNGKPLRVVSVHFDHCDAETRLPQVRYAIQKLMVDHAMDGGAWNGFHGLPLKKGWEVFGPSLSTRAVILVGDLNFDHRSEEYALFVGRMSEEHGRMTGRNGFVDAHVAAGTPEEQGVSHMNGKRIDHVMVWAPLRPAIEKCWIDNAAEGSDHYPVWLQFDAGQLPEADRF